MTKIGNRKNLCRAALTLVLLACAALSLNSRVAFGTVAPAGVVEESLTLGARGAFECGLEDAVDLFPATHRKASVS